MARRSLDRVSSISCHPTHPPSLTAADPRSSPSFGAGVAYQNASPSLDPLQPPANPPPFPAVQHLVQPLRLARDKDPSSGDYVGSTGIDVRSGCDSVGWIEDAC